MTHFESDFDAMLAGWCAASQLPQESVTCPVTEDHEYFLPWHEGVGMFARGEPCPKHPNVELCAQAAY